MVHRKRHVDRGARTGERPMGKIAQRSWQEITTASAVRSQKFTSQRRTCMLVGLAHWAIFFYVGLFATVHLSFAAGEPLKLKIIYSSFTGAYTPLWLAVDDLLGKKYGLDFEAVYAGRARPHPLLLSGEAQNVVSHRTGVVCSSHAE